jgi:hypothetical protein
MGAVQMGREINVEIEIKQNRYLEGKFPRVTYTKLRVWA